MRQPDKHGTTYYVLVPTKPEEAHDSRSCDCLACLADRIESQDSLS